MPGLFCLGRGAGYLRVGAAHLGQGIKLVGAGRRVCRVCAEQQAFLRSLDKAGSVTPGRTGGGLVDQDPAVA